MLLVHSLIVSLHFMFVLNFTEHLFDTLPNSKIKKLKKKCLMTDKDWKLSRVILVAYIIQFFGADLFQI